MNTPVMPAPRKTRFRSLLSLAALVVGLAAGHAARAAPQWVANSNIAGSSGGNVTVTVPSHQANDILLIQVLVRDTNDTITWPLGWTELATVDRGTTARYWWAWARAASNNAYPTVQVNKSTGNGDTYAAVSVYRGAATSGSPWDAVGTPNTGTGAAHTLNGITTTTADTFVIASLCGEDNNTATGTTFSATDPATLQQILYVESGEGNDGACTAGAFTKTTAGATGNVTATWTADPAGSGGIVLALKSSGVPVGYPLTQCAGDRFGSNLGCTANDVQITSLVAENGPAFCKAGDFVTLNFAVTVNSGSPNRHDIGIFFSNDGKDPQLRQVSGGPSSCSVFVLPTPSNNPSNNPFAFLDIDPGPFSGSYDTCGDVNGSMNPGLIEGVPDASYGILHVTNVTVKCQSKDGAGGKLFVPFVLSWDQQASPTGKLCTSAANPVPGTTSKCNAPTVAQATVTGIVVLPKIEKSDGITVIDDNQSTTYSVVITNNTGATLGDAGTGTYAYFRDPAVANLTVTGVSCTAAGGATCPALSPTPNPADVATLQGGTGIQLPVMPAGSSLTFSVNATVNNGTPDGTLISNTAIVSYIGQETSATDTNTVGQTTLDHYELSLATSSVACEPTTVTVTACAGAATSSPCTSVYSGGDVNGQAATLTTTAGTLGATPYTFTTGVASTTLSYPTAPNNTSVTVTLAGVPTAAPNPTLCCQGGSCTAANSCTTTFDRNALFVSDTNGGSPANIPHQTAGIKSGDFWLRAVKTKGDGTCDDALKGNVNISFAYECNNPATCYAANMMRIDTGAVTTISRNNSGGVTSYTAKQMSFNNAGYAPFALIYDDVGLVTLYMNYNNGELTGVSNAFVVKPYDLVFPTGFATCVSPHCAAALGAGGSNPAAADETGGAFVKAGSDFSVAITAVAANYSATPSFGTETPPEVFKVTHSFVAPNVSGSNNPALVHATNFTVAPGTGTVTGTNFRWSEVGIIKFNAPEIGDGNYLAAGNVIGNNPSGNVGRFIPHHFKVTDTPGCSAVFTYSGQAFTATATARNLAGGTTQNYRGTPAFARETTFSDASGLSSCANTTLVAANYSAGAGSLPGIACTYTAKETVPGIGLRAVDADSVTSADGNPSDGDDSIPLRSGRVRLFNAYGSELLDLAMPMRVEYYKSTADGWVTTADDTCSSVTLKTFTNFKRQLGAGETCVQDTGNPGVSGQGCSGAGPAAERYLTTPSSGGFNLWLRAPGEGNYGSVDVTADLPTSGRTWMQYDWDGNGTHDNDPTGTATFGTFRGNPRHIHLRELY